MKRSLVVTLPFVLLAGCGEEQTVQGNRPPVLVIPGPQIVVEGGLVQFSVATSDPDDDPVTLTVSDLPQNASFAQETGQLLWVPDHKQQGNYNIRFVASDGRFEVQSTVAVAVVD